MTKQCYWSHNGKHQAESERLAELMPMSGKCDTIAGELVRAYSKLYYDFNNNGMGNNTSGAVNFLLEQGAISEDTHAEIHHWTRGRIYEGNYDVTRGLAKDMEAMVNEVIEFILAHPELETTPNEDDMFNYQEDEQQFCETCGVEIEESCGWGWQCESCHETQEEEDNTCQGCWADTRYYDCDCDDEEEYEEY